MKSVVTVIAVCTLLLAAGPLVAAGSSSAPGLIAGAAPGPAPRGVPPTDDSLWVKADSVNIGSPGDGGFNGTKIYGDTIFQVNNINNGNYIIRKFDRLTGALLASFSSPSTEYAMGLSLAGDSIYVACFVPGNQFDVYTRAGTYVRTFAAPGGRMCRGLDWDGGKFWVADNSTTPPTVYTMDRAGTLLRALANTGTPAVYWIFDLALDRMIPNRLWLNDETSPFVTDYCSFDTSANTYTVLATFTHPASPQYPEGISFYGPELGAGFVYTVGNTGPWVYKMQVHEPVGYKVMLAFSDNVDSQYVWQLAQTLRDSSGGEFTAVDTYGFSTRASFPAAQWYAAGYRAIFVYTNTWPLDTTLMGDSLAAFIELGGGVVDAIASNISPWGVHGRYRNQYSPFSMTTTYSGSDTMSLVHNPSHPIMNGVTSFGYTGSLGGNNAHGNLRGTNSVCLAEWSHSNRVAVAYFDSGGHRAAGLGIFPMWHYTGYPNIGQWVRVYVNALKWVAGSSTGIEEPEARPENLITTCGPNPFRNYAQVGYALPRATRVSLTVFTAAGRLVRTLADGNQAPGSHQAVWDGRDDNGRSAGRGVYYCRLQAGGLGGTTKLVKIE
jgi:hypothetical protein